MKTELRGCFICYANAVVETQIFGKDRGAEFAAQKRKEATDAFHSALKKYINFDKLTKKEAVELGFKECEWIENLYLIPIYLLPILPIGLKLMNIFGNEFEYDGTNIEADERGGLLACGINFGNRRESAYNRLLDEPFLITEGPTGGDETSPYYVQLRRECTVREFIEYYVTTRVYVSGSFSIRDMLEHEYLGSVNFKHGKITDVAAPDYILDSKVDKAGGSGGWGQASFTLYI